MLCLLSRSVLASFLALAAVVVLAQQQNATATGKGTAVNAKDNAKVTINNFNYSKDPADQERIKALERRLAELSAVQQEQYRQGFLDAQKLAQEPNALAKDKAAFAALQAARTGQAVESAREKELAAVNLAQANNAEAAKWARHQAVFEQLSKPDSMAATRALQRAVAYEPGSYLNQWLLGDAFKSIGNSVQAATAYKSMRDLIRMQLDRDPSNKNLERDLSVSFNKIGDLQNAEGKRTEALASYQAGLVIAKRLAELDKANTHWQTGLVVSFWKISGLVPAKEAAALLQQGLSVLQRLDTAGALRADQKGWQAMLQSRLDGLKP
jgi:tetratricopeptide (TPR) repeat protein